MEKRLQTIIAHAGVASRRHAALIIEEGRITVDGKRVTKKGFRLDPLKHEITVDGTPIGGKEKEIYFLFNKPVDVITTAKDTHERKTVIDFFKGVNARLYPVGRLDRNTSGLLVITNDGDLANRLSHPRYEVDKVYMTRVRDKMNDDELRKLEKGVDIDGKRTSPCEISFLSVSRNGALYRIRIHEGRKRQVRKMFEAVGTKVLTLERVEYAGIKLKGLKRGEYRELSEGEVKRLKEI